MIIDTHAHIIVPKILREAAPEEAWRPRVTWEDGKQLIEYGGKRIGSATREFVQIEEILREMTNSHVDGVLLCPWVSLARYDAPAQEAQDSCQIQNDALVSLAAKHPDRIAVLGLVPLQDIPLAVKELERLMSRGAKGVEIGTNVNGIYPGDDRFRPFWEACEALEALVFFHPMEGGGRAELRDYYMWNVIGNPMETTIAAAHLVLSGVMEAHPGLKILLAHAGGSLPYLQGRLDRGFQQRDEIRKVIPRPPSEYLKQFYFDSITHNPAILRGLVEQVGAERVLLGSDYPFDMGNTDPVERVRGAKLSPGQEQKILGNNARTLLAW